MLHGFLIVVGASYSDAVEGQLYYPNTEQKEARAATLIPDKVFLSMKNITEIDVLYWLKGQFITKLTF